MRSDDPDMRRFGLAVLAIMGVVIGCGSRSGDRVGPALGGVTFVEELRVGVAEGRDPYMLGEVNYLGVSSDGTIYAADEQVGTVRIYRADGEHLGDAGRIGEGPGEYRRIKGLQVLPNGRMALFDAARGRVVLFAADGRGAGEFETRSARWSGRHDLEIDGAGRLLVRTVLSPGDPAASEYAAPRQVYDVYGTDGALMTTIDLPVARRSARDLPAPNSPGAPLVFGLAAAGGPLWPFTTAEVWVWSPNGHFLVGRNDVYDIEARISDRIAFTFGRQIQPARIHEQELRQWDEIGAFMRKDRARRSGIQPGGYGFPEAKPFFRDIFAGREGKIWVWRYVEARETVPLPDIKGSGRPPLTWREPPTFDGFDEQGEYLGSVVLPFGFAPKVWRGNRVWGVYEDDAGVRFILRLKLTPRPDMIEVGP